MLGCGPCASAPAPNIKATSWKYLYTGTAKAIEQAAPPIGQIRSMSQLNTTNGHPGTTYPGLRFPLYGLQHVHNVTRVVPFCTTSSLGSVLFDPSYS